MVSVQEPMETTGLSEGLASEAPSFTDAHDTLPSDKMDTNDQANTESQSRDETSPTNGAEPIQESIIPEVTTQAETTQGEITQAENIQEETTQKETTHKELTSEEPQLMEPPQKEHAQDEETVKEDQSNGGKEQEEKRPEAREDVTDEPTKAFQNGLRTDVCVDAATHDGIDDDYVVEQVLNAVVNNSSPTRNAQDGDLNDYLVYDEDEQIDNSRASRSLALVPQTEHAKEDRDEDVPMVGIESITEQETGDADFAIIDESGPVYGMKESEVDDQQAATVDDAKEEVFVVERILDKKIGTNGSIKYLVKWQNYSSRDNSWEPIDNLIDCNEAMIKFELERAKKLAKRHENDDGQEEPNRDKYTKSFEYEVNDLMGLVVLENEKYFLVSLVNSTRKVFVRASLASAIFPTKVIDFYIKNMRWKPQVEE